MVEDMRMRTLAPKTQTAYIRAVRKFAKFLGHSPDTATLSPSLTPIEIKPAAKRCIESILGASFSRVQLDWRFD